MNTLLLKHKPLDSSNEEFTKAWNNSGYVLEALHTTLQTLKEELNGIKKDDFDCPNHYAKLAYNMGQIKAYDFIISMLPETSKR